MKLLLTLVLSLGLLAAQAVPQHASDASRAPEYHKLALQVKKAQAALDAYIASWQKDCVAKGQALTMDAMGDPVCAVKPQPLPPVTPPPVTPVRP